MRIICCFVEHFFKALTEYRVGKSGIDLVQLLDIAHLEDQILCNIQVDRTRHTYPSSLDILLKFRVIQHTCWRDSVHVRSPIVKNEHVSLWLFDRSWKSDNTGVPVSEQAGCFPAFCLYGKLVCRVSEQAGCFQR